jgi:transcription factor E
MPIKFLKSIVGHLAGKPAEIIVDLLIGKKDVNEFIICKKLNLTINQTRNILYKLSDYGLVSFIRKKDKKKGWYIYYWTLNVHTALKLLEENLNQELAKLNEQLKSRNDKRFYTCNTCMIEVGEEIALMNDFICPECEEVYQLSEKNEVIQKLQKEISKFQKDLELVKELKNDEESKIGKKRARIVKKRETKKKQEAETRRIERKKERDKLKKAEGKTVVKKKVEKVKKAPSKKIKANPKK